MRANIFKEVLAEKKKREKRKKGDYSDINKREVGAWVLDHGLTERFPCAGRGVWGGAEIWEF